MRPSTVTLNTRTMPIDQYTSMLLQAMAAQGMKPLHESTPAELRAGGGAAAPGPVPAMHTVTNRTITTGHGELPVRVLVPSASPNGTLLYFHGGGWVLGDLDGFDVLGRSIAAAADVTVVLVDYRLAPEHPYPAALQDAWAAVRWAAQPTDDMPGIAGPLFLAGDSAGANLAIVTALRAREAGPEIAGTALVYPVTDCDLDRPSYVDPANQLLVSRPTMEWFFDHYLGDRDRTVPEVSPLREPDLSGFPPTAIVLAQYDPLRDEGEAFAARLADAGVPVEQRLFEGQMHGFFQMINVLPAGAQAVAWLADQFRSGVLNVGKESA